MAVSINQGTQTAIATDPVGTTQYQIIKLDQGAAGASSLFTGTIGAVTNLAAGTITKLNGGTLNAIATGTINTGTIDTISQLPPNVWGTVVSTGTNTLGTIKPLVSGSQIFVTDMTISTGSATTLVIGSGGTSTPILGTLFFAANGGAVENYRTPLQTVAGSALVYQQTTGGPLTITASGFVR